MVSSEASLSLVISSGARNLEPVDDKRDGFLPAAEMTKKSERLLAGPALWGIRYAGLL
jgi:hypothetical protein